MIAETGVDRGSRPSPTTWKRTGISWYVAAKAFMKRPHPEGEIFGCEDTAQVLILVHDKDAISALGSAELTGVGD